MAQWYPNADGTMGCRECRVASFRMGTGHCNCPRTSAVAPTLPVGPMQALTAAAEQEGMLDRLAVERMLAERVRRADRDAAFFRRLAKRALKQGVTKQTAEGPMDADEQATAQKWCMVSESANGRGDKSARALYTLVCDRERRAELERREALAAGVLSRPGKAQARGTA